MPSAKRLRTNSIVFTLNNYSEEECVSIKNSITSLTGHLHFAIVGKEIGESGTPHLQGFVRLKKSFLLARDGSLSKWRSLIPALARAHMEPAYGSDQDSENYCSKEGNLLIRVGTPSTSESGNNRFQDLLRATTFEEIVELDPQFAAKNYFQAQAIVKNNTMNSTKPTSPALLKAWQLKVLKKLIFQNRRKITFVEDEGGNSGKSMLAHFIAGRLQPKEVFYCRGGKSADIVHAFSKNAHTCKYAIFDYARNKQPEYFAWDLIEELKDGGITSLKYDGNCFWLAQPIKVLVFTNHSLDNHRHRLTEDRWDVHVLYNADNEAADIRPEDHPELCEAFNIRKPEDPPQVEEPEEIQLPDGIQEPNWEPDWDEVDAAFQLFQGPAAFQLFVDPGPEHEILLGEPATP